MGYKKENFMFPSKLYTCHSGELLTKRLKIFKIFFGPGQMLAFENVFFSNFWGGLKGTVSRDFLPLVFVVNKHLPGLLGVS